MIPPRLIQTGKNRELSSMARASSANLRLLHPSWDYVYFDDAAVQDFMADESPEHRTIFANFPRKIQKFDFFRYLAVYKLGGFYFDLDVFLWTKLDDLLQADCVFPFEEITLNRFIRQQLGMDWEIGNYAFAAAAGHPFLEKVIENCVRAQRDPAWLQPALQSIPAFFREDHYVLNSTGPGLITRTLAENPDGVTVLFPDDVCDENTWHHFGNYGVHLMEGSWRDRGSYLRKRLTNLWEARTQKRFMPESRALGPRRTVNGRQWTVDSGQLGSGNR